MADPMKESKWGDDWHNADRRKDQVQRQYAYLSGQFNGITNGISKFKTEVFGMSKVNEKIMKTMLQEAYDKLFLFVQQVCLLPQTDTRLGRDHQEVWTALTSAERAFGDVDWELGHSEKDLVSAAMSAMQEGDTVHEFAKRWTEFKNHAHDESIAVNKDKNSTTVNEYIHNYPRGGGNSGIGGNAGWGEIQRAAAEFNDRTNKLQALEDALRDIHRKMETQSITLTAMAKEYGDMYSKIIDDKNCALDMWGALKGLSGSALETNNPLSTRDGALGHLISALKKQKARDQHGGTVVPNNVDKIVLHINQKLGWTVG